MTKRLLLILLACSSVLLAGCDDSQREYEMVRSTCTTTGFMAQSVDRYSANFWCLPSPKLKQCMKVCDSDACVDDCIAHGEKECMSGYIGVFDMRITDTYECKKIKQ